jgi:hypothetical protein
MRIKPNQCINNVIYRFQHFMKAGNARVTGVLSKGSLFY